MMVYLVYGQMTEWFLKTQKVKYMMHSFPCGHACRLGEKKKWPKSTLYPKER